MFAEITSHPIIAIILLSLLLLVGSFAGTLAGLFGVGGGIILVPAISMVLQQLGVPVTDAVRVAVATSLATIIPTSLTSLSAHHRRGNINWAILRHWIPLLIIGALLGGYLARFVNGKVLSFCFSLLLLFMAWQQLKERRENEIGEESHHRIALPYQCVMAFAIGCSSSMLGIGGGVIGVPTLCAVGLPLKRAIGTASAFGMVVAIPAVGSYLLASPLPGIPLGGTVGLMHPFILVMLVPGALVGAPFGVRLSQRLPVVKLRRAFAALLVVLGFKMLYSSLG